MTGESYSCAECGVTFQKTRDDRVAEAEAAALWGVERAATNPGMAIVCDECFKAICRREGIEEIPR